MTKFADLIKITSKKKFIFLSVHSFVRKLALMLEGEYKIQIKVVTNTFGMTKMHFGSPGHGFLGVLQPIAWSKGSHRLRKYS